MGGGQDRFYLTYKAERLGMKVGLVDEHYTTRTCPACGNVKKSKVKSRNYDCQPCGSQFHRDQVGAMNIRNKYRGCVPVVGQMARPVGILYTDVAHREMRSHPRLRGV